MQTTHKIGWKALLRQKGEQKIMKSIVGTDYITRNALESSRPYISS